MLIITSLWWFGFLGFLATSEIPYIFSYLSYLDLNAAVFPSVPDGWRNEDTITSPEIYIKMNALT